MSVYLIGAVQVEDKQRYEEYIRKALPSFDGRDVKMLALSENHQVLEGEDVPNRIVLLQFPDMPSAKAWYQSEDYQKNAVPVRRDAARTSFIVLLDAEDGGAEG